MATRCMHLSEIREVSPSADGCPEFVEEPPGDGCKKNPEILDDIKIYVNNLAKWLAPAN